MSTRVLGMILVTVSAVVFSTAGLFVKSISAGSWDIIFWRGVFSVFFSMLYVVATGRFGSEVRRTGKSGIIIGLVGAIATAAFVPAFKLTTIANVTLIYGATPIIASILAFLLVGEKIRPLVILSIGLAFSGVAVIVSGSLGAGHFAGDGLALIMAFGMAVMMVLYRVWPDTPAAGPAMVSSVLLIAVGGMLGRPLAISGDDLPLLALFGLVFALASITLAEGAKRISAGQTALLSGLETPLAPLLAWLVLAEMPALATWIGGAMVFTAVVMAQIAGRRDP